MAGRSSVKFNIKCSQKTFRGLPRTFRASGRTSVYFRQLSLRSEDLLSIFLAIRKPSTNFRQYSMRLGDFFQLPTFLCVVQKIFRQHSIRPGDRPSTSSNFRVGENISVNFCQHFVPPGVFPSTSVNFLCSQDNFRKFL